MDSETEDDQGENMNTKEIFNYIVLPYGIIVTGLWFWMVGNWLYRKIRNRHQGKMKEDTIQDISKLQDQKGMGSASKMMQNALMTMGDSE